MKPQVLIIGAGPTGLTLALELTLKGVSVRVIDCAPPRPKYESRAIGTHARTMEIFARLNVLDEMLDCGLRWNGFNLFANNKKIGRLDFNRINSKFNFALIIPQAESERILRDKLTEIGVKVEHETALESFSQNSESATATLRDRSGAAEIVEAAFLIGCDGAKSRTRKLLDLEFAGQRLQGSYLMDCEIEWGQPPLTEGSTFLADGWRLIIGQLPANRFRVVANLSPDDPRFSNVKPTVELMQQFIDEFALQLKIFNPTWASAFNLSVRRVEKMRVCRIFLAGDAAHNVCPNAGQGMNAGVHDAVVLADKLSLFLRQNIDSLDEYEAERLPVIKNLLVASERLENLMTLKNGVAANLRNILLPLTLKPNFVQNKIARQISGLNVKVK